MWETRRLGAPVRLPRLQRDHGVRRSHLGEALPPTRDPEHHWLAFDAEGNQVAAMFLPSRFVAEQIGVDWVLVRITEDLGLERAGGVWTGGGVRVVVARDGPR